MVRFNFFKNNSQSQWFVNGAGTYGAFSANVSHHSGMATCNTTGGINSYTYELSDHLGNVRVTLGKNVDDNISQLFSATDYYPGGMALPGRMYRLEDYRFGYQGKYAEKDQETGYNQFELRLYDPRIIRWNTTDAYGQHWSPYLAMGNNPVSIVDPDGGWDSKLVGRINRWGAVLSGQDPGALYQSGNDWGFNTWDGADGVTFNFKDYGNSHTANILWNSEFMRSKIPDRLTVGVEGNIAEVLGYGKGVELNLITRGHEAGFFLTNTEGKRYGLEGDLGFSAGVSSYNGSALDITRKSVEGRSYDLDGGYGFGGNINVALNPDDNTVTWIGVKASLGMTLGVSFGINKTKPKMSY